MFPLTAIVFSSILVMFNIMGKYPEISLAMLNFWKINIYTYTQKFITHNIVKHVA